MKGLEGLKALAGKPAPAMASPMMGDDEGAEGEDPKRTELLQHADDLMAALKANDREAVADVLEACGMGGGGYGDGEA